MRSVPSQPSGARFDLVPPTATTFRLQFHSTVRTIHAAICMQHAALEKHRPFIQPKAGDARASPEIRTPIPQ